MKRALIFRCSCGGDFAGSDAAGQWPGRAVTARKVLTAGAWIALNARLGFVVAPPTTDQLPGVRRGRENAFVAGATGRRVFHDQRRDRLVAASVIAEPLNESRRSR